MQDYILALSYPHCSLNLLCVITIIWYNNFLADFLVISFLVVFIYVFVFYFSDKWEFFACDSNVTEWMSGNWENAFTISYEISMSFINKKI